MGDGKSGSHASDMGQEKGKGHNKDEWKKDKN
jgi:hypothetical protein